MSICTCGGDSNDAFHADSCPFGRNGEQAMSDRLKRAFEAAGFTHVSCEWEPISSGCEMEGAAGGWTIWSGEHVAATAYNAAGLLRLLATKASFADPIDASCAVVNWDVLGWAS